MSNLLYLCLILLIFLLNSDVPAGIKGLSEEDRNKYVKLTTSSETEKRHFVRIMFVGKESVGKTCLVKRLLGESIDDEPPSTDGVDIIIRRCKINIENGEWIIDQGMFTIISVQIIKIRKNLSMLEDYYIKICVLLNNSLL